MSRRASTLAAAVLALAISGFAAQADPSAGTNAVNTLPQAAVKAAAQPGEAAATALLKQLAGGNIGGVYAQLSAPMQRKLPLLKFKTIVEPLVKSGMKEIAWRKANVKKTAYGYDSNIGFYSDRTTVTLNGELKTLTAGLVDIVMRLVKSGDSYQMEGFDFKTRPGTLPKPAHTAMN